MTRFLVIVGLAITRSVCCGHISARSGWDGVRRDNATLYFPLLTSLLASGLLSLVLWLV